MSREWRTAAACTALALIAFPGIQLLIVGRRLLDDEELLGRGYVLCIAGGAMAALSLGAAIAVALGVPTARFNGLVLGVLVIPASLWGANAADRGWVAAVGAPLGFLVVVLLAQKGVLGFAFADKPGRKLPPTQPPRDWADPRP